MHRSTFNQKGQSLTEYLILVLFISVASIAATRSLGQTLKRKLELAQRHIESDVGLNKNSWGSE